MITNVTTLRDAMSSVTAAEPGSQERFALRATVAVVVCSMVSLLAGAALFVGKGGIQAVLLGLTVLCVPGVFVAKRAAAQGLAAATVLVLSVSLTSWMVIAHLLLSVEWWRPRVAAVVACVALAGIGFVLAWRDRSVVVNAPRSALVWSLPSIDRASTVHLALLGAALGLWWTSLDDIDLGGIGHWGLVTELPPAWIVALVVAVGVAASSSIAARSSGLVNVLGIGTVLTIVYATLPSLVSTARYPWSYKHVGVIRLLSETGHLHPQVDIYNNFSGMFGLGAMLRSATEVDPTSYIPWTQLVVEAAVVTAVIALVSTIADSRRAGRVAGVFYIVANWVGQNYFSPQAIASLLALTVMTFTWAWFATGRTRSLPLIGRLVGSLGPVQRTPTPVETRPGVGARLIVAFMFLGLMMTHALTPAVVCGSLFGAVVLGWVRDRWLVVSFCAVTIGWFVRCAPYFAAQEFDLGFGGSPSDNASGVLDYSEAPRPVVIVGYLTRAFSIGIWVAAIIAALYCVWARRRPGGLLLVAVVPFMLPLIQSYGGEVVYRVYLYSLPLVVGLLASAILVWSPRWSTNVVACQRWLAVAVAVAMVPGFIVAHYGREEINLVAESEVAMEDWIRATLPRPSLVAQFGDNYPADATEAYPYMRISDTYTPQITALLGARQDLPSSADLDEVADDLVALTPHRVFVVVAPGMIRSTLAADLLPVTSTSAAVELLADHSRFTVVHQIDDTFLLEVQR